ncbi:uncharacterized protein LOC110725341 [Chenopodium quinoa]|uniref:uncharacterized protein LOC110725341 n=1 Tax=Chenopodium quinoa TaxID=63459 RepID=UPI000B779825|nr:uncharacterized protein LOC110725341 [Chenopodium quinoa]
MGMGMGWYGPLIDLSAASSHVGDFVQLIVFVHHYTPVQYKLGRGREMGRGRGELIRTDISVGDETRPQLSITLWNNHLASSVSAGDILFFRNVKVCSYAGMLQATSVEYSSILRLIHPFHSLLSRGVDDLLTTCRLVGTAKDKLRRVIQWVHHTRSTLSYQQPNFHQTTPAPRNWKVHQEQKPRQCFLLSQVLHLSTSCKAIFHASIGQVFLHSLWPHADNERLFIRSRLTTKADFIVEDMICTGCHLCGFPLCSDSATVGKQSPLYCAKSSNRLHTVGLIYRPFMLYVWDDSEYIPLHVTNKAAEFLFGNIIAEDVYQSYKGQKDHQCLKNPFKAYVNKQNHGRVEAKGIGSSSSVRAVGLEMRKHNDAKSPNFYLIWLIVLRLLLLKGKNSSLKFEVLVNPSLEIEDGRFEMISVSMSCE